MAIYFLNVKSFGRGNGSSAVSAAAYRSGERLRDARTGKIYDHSDRQDLLHKEIILPKQFSASDMAWAKDRANLWNTAERAEIRRDARVAREYLVALPVELSAKDRLDLVSEFSRELVERYGFALDVAVHAPRDFPGSDPRNFHAHLLATTREVTAAGLGAKTTAEWNGENRRAAGLGSGIQELLHVRGRWAAVTNEALRAAQVAARVDHRSLRAQGIDREPGLHIPRAALEIERRGDRSFVADRLRAARQARLDSSLQNAAAREPVARPALSSIQRSAQAAQEWRRYRDNKPPEPSKEEVLQRWMRYRESELRPKAEGIEEKRESRENAADSAPAKSKGRDHGNDFGL